MEPLGNKEFLSALSGIPVSKFYEGKIENLMKMLELGRIDLFIFERASSMTTIKKLKIKGVYYHYSTKLAASLAVRKDKKGSKLKSRIDALFKKIDKKFIFNNYFKFMELPKKGEVSINN